MAQFELTTFMPGEAERITTLATGLQRDWRKRGFIPANDGHARFDLFGLAEMLALKTLADRGVGPAVGQGVASWLAVGIAWHVLNSVDAYEGDHFRTNEARGLPPRPPMTYPPGPKGVVFKAAMEHLVSKGLLSEEDLERRRGFDGDWLAKQVIRLKGYPRIIPAKFFIWWADGTHTFAASLDAAFGDGGATDDRWGGAVIVLDLDGIASTIMQRAGRPFVHVEFPIGDDGKLEPPMEYGAVIPLSAALAVTETSVETTPALPQKDLTS